MKKWIDRITHQAIIDALKIIEAKITGRYMPEARSDDQNIMIAIGGIMYFGIFFVLAAKWIAGGG